MRIEPTRPEKGLSPLDIFGRKREFYGHAHKSAGNILLNMKEGRKRQAVQGGTERGAEGSLLTSLSTSNAGLGYVPHSKEEYIDGGWLAIESSNHLSTDLKFSTVENPSARRLTASKKPSPYWKVAV